MKRKCFSIVLPLELANDGTGTFRGNVVFSGSSRVTYVLQAVDNRGVAWLDYTTAELPASGVVLGVPMPVDVELSANGRHRAVRH